MKVYIVERGMYDQADIVGIYASPQLAMAAHPAPEGYPWKQFNEREWSNCLEGDLQWTQRASITEHEVVERLQITYTSDPDNCREVFAFVAPQPKCSTCNGYGEYETEYGPRGCNLCCSRLVPIFENTVSGHQEYVDWGDTVVREADGRLRVIKEQQL